MKRDDKVAHPLRRMTDSLDLLHAGAQNLINQHDINIMSNDASMEAHGHLKSLHAHVYMRAGRALVPGEGVVTLEVLDTLDLTSICVEPQYRRQGFFLKFLNGLEALANENGRILRVECVVDENVDGFLAKRVGYTRDPYSPSSFYWRQPA